MSRDSDAFFALQQVAEQQLNGLGDRIEALTMSLNEHGCDNAYTSISSFNEILGGIAGTLKSIEQRL